MGRRGKKTPAGKSIVLPWLVSAALALAAFAALRWLLPGLVPQEPLPPALRAHAPFLAALGQMAGPLSWIALFGFGALAVAAALRARRAPRMAPARALAPLASAQARPAPAVWSLEALRMLEWKRFELLCARYYEALGFQARTLAAGADGGVDVTLFKGDPARPLALVQCKAWNARQVGVKEVRELLGVMVHTGVGRGVFITTGSFSKEALAFGAANPIQLLDGPAFDEKLRALAPAAQDALLAWAFEGDYLTPSCPSCGVKMLARESRGGPFWGCRHYPACKSTLKNTLKSTLAMRAER